MSAGRDDTAWMIFPAFALGWANLAARCWALTLIWGWHVAPRSGIALHPSEAVGLLMMAQLLRPPRMQRKPDPTGGECLGLEIGHSVGILLAVAVAWAVSP